MAFLTLTILLIWPVFPYVVLAILLAYFLSPVNAWLQRYVSSAGLRAGLLTLLCFVILTFPLAYAVQRITRELGSANQVERAQRLIESGRAWLASRNAEVVAHWIEQIIEQGREFLLSSIPGLFGSVFGISLGIFVCLFVFYYFTKEGGAIWDTFLKALPLPQRIKTKLTQDVTGILNAILIGQLLTAIVQGLLGGIGLLVFQVPQPVLLTVLMILLAFFPFVGATLVWLPAGILKLVAGQTAQGLGLLIYGFVVVMNVDNVLRPRLIARRSQVHPVVVLIGIIGGTKVFGFIGFLVGPVIFAIFLQLLRFFAEYRVAEEPPFREPAV